MGGRLQRSSPKGPRQGHVGVVDEASKLGGHGLSWSRKGVIGEGLG